MVIKYSTHAYSCHNPELMDTWRKCSLVHKIIQHVGWIFGADGRATKFTENDTAHALEELAYANCHEWHLAQRIVLVCAGLSIALLLGGIYLSYSGRGAIYQLTELNNFLSLHKGYSYLLPGGSFQRQSQINLLNFSSPFNTLNLSSVLQIRKTFMLKMEILTFQSCLSEKVQKFWSR